jgi:hypothetical protein
MLIRRKRLFWFGITLLVVGIASLVLPPYGGYCESNLANKYYCAAYEMMVALFAFVDAHNGAVTAIATIFIGLFTYTLKRSTDKMWDAGERQIKTTRQIAAVEMLQMRISLREAAKSAEAASKLAGITRIGVIDLERAYFAVGPTQIVVDFVRTDIVKARGHYIGADSQELTVHLFVQNTGRTSATIKKVDGMLTDRLPLGDTPFYIPSVDQPVITDLAIAAGVARRLDPFEFKSDIIGKQFFWGYIEYTDIFKNVRISRFCAHLEPAVRGQEGKYQIAGSDRWRECD